MLDVYEFREGVFEVVDTQMQDLRSRRMLYFRLVRFVLILLVIAIITIIFLAFVTTNFLWLLLILIPSGFIVFGYQNLQRLQKKLAPEISSIMLEYDQNKEITNFKIRRWRQNKIDEFLEEEIRHNQAIGFKVIWYDSGLFDIEIIVDKAFPGTKIFKTWDFFVIAELKVFFEVAISSLDTWIYQLEDDTPWTQDAIDDLEEELQVARVPWTVREYFSEL